ncbi:MAG: uL15 family ribosomal protein [Methanobacteriota archaeon]
MAQKDKKTQSMRGTRTCGYGNTQKHRGAGSRGGRGLAGSKKHKWNWVSKNLPGHFGRSGFTRHKSTIKRVSFLNIGDLDGLCEVWELEGKVKKTKGVLEVDLSSFGFDKLLGSGKVSGKYNIKVDSCSQKALEKIEALGGKVEVENKAEVVVDAVDLKGGVKEPSVEDSDEPGVSEAGDKVST